MNATYEQMTPYTQASMQMVFQIYKNKQIYANLHHGSNEKGESCHDQPQIMETDPLMEVWIRIVNQKANQLATRYC